MKVVKVAIQILCLSLCACAQTPGTRTVTLTWTDTANPVGTTYTVYKTSDLAAPLSAYVVVARNITAKTYVETGVIPGIYRYYVKAVYNNSESIPSNTADADAKPFAPLLLRAETTVEVPAPVQ